MKLIVDNITPFSEDLGHFKDALAVANISIETEYPRSNLHSSHRPLRCSPYKSIHKLLS